MKAIRTNSLPSLHPPAHLKLSSGHSMNILILWTDENVTESQIEILRLSKSSHWPSSFLLLLVLGSHKLAN